MGKIPRSRACNPFFRSQGEEDDPEEGVQGSLPHRWRFSPAEEAARGARRWLGVPPPRCPRIPELQRGSCGTRIPPAPHSPAAAARCLPRRIATGSAGGSARTGRTGESRSPPRQAARVVQRKWEEEEEEVEKEQERAGCACGPGGGGEGTGRDRRGLPRHMCAELVRARSGDSGAGTFPALWGYSLCGESPVMEGQPSL